MQDSLLLSLLSPKRRRVMRLEFTIRQIQVHPLRWTEKQHRLLDGERNSEALSQCSASEYICAKLILNLQLVKFENLLAIG